MYLFCLLVINVETAVNLSEDTELFTQKVWMMMGMEVMWRRGLNDKLTQWNSIFSENDSLTALITTEEPQQYNIASIENIDL